MYTPPSGALAVLDRIPNWFVHPKTTTIATALNGKKFMCTFPSGQLYFESKLDLDTDGSVFSAQDPTGQMTTSAKDASGKSLDADAINYFVLPGGFYAAHGISIGDIAVVIYGSRRAYACLGDVGPHHQLGEGSISLHRDLGHETISGRRPPSHPGHLINAGISSGVITIVFPGSGNGQGRTNADSAAIGQPLFQKLQQEANPIGDFSSQSTRNFA